MSLSCTACRRRKVKCDKAILCTPCAKAGLPCVYPERQQRPPDLKRQRTDDPTSSRSAETIKTPLQEAHRDATSSADLRHLDSRYASFVRAQDNARSINRTFWNQLDESAEHAKSASLAESREQSDADAALAAPLGFPAHFIFGNNAESEQTDLLEISDRERAFLVPVFFARVHPICRILHEPTALAFIKDMDQMMNAKTRKLKYGSLRAIDCAMAFAAAKTLSPEECEMELGFSKNKLENRLRRMLELTLSACDIVNSKELVTLQALTLYIMSMCTTKSTQSSWALLALAIRIAQGLGMHRDGDGSSWDVFHAEMRRRLWWQLIVLDVLLSSDRGSEPLIRAGSFTTRRPLHINDADISLNSQAAVRELPSQIVDMTLPLVYMEAFHVLRSINLSQASTEAQANLASSFLENLESTYDVKTKISNSTAACDHRLWLISVSGQLLSLVMWLAVQYPLHRRVVEPQEFSRRQALRTALALLAMRQRTEEAASAAPFLWWFRMIEPWHALAVALSILCSEKSEKVINEAWPVVSKAYERCDARFSGAGHGDVWSPLQSLMSKARAHVSRHIPGDVALSLVQPQQTPQDSSPVHARKTESPVMETKHVPGFMGEAQPETYFGYHAMPWTNEWSTGSSPEGNDTWEHWNMFVEGLDCVDPNANLSMTDAWTF